MGTQKLIFGDISRTSKALGCQLVHHLPNLSSYRHVLILINILFYITNFQIQIYYIKIWTNITHDCVEYNKLDLALGYW